MEGSIHGCIDPWMDERMEGLIHGGIDPWMDGWTNGSIVPWMDGRMDGWINHHSPSSARLRLLLICIIKTTCSGFPGS